MPSQARQGRIAGEHLAVWTTEKVALPHVVPHADAIKSPRVGSLRDLDQRGANLACPSWPTKIIDVESQFHTAIPPIIYKQAFSARELTQSASALDLLLLAVSGSSASRAKIG